MNTVSTRYHIDGTYNVQAGRDRIAMHHAAANAKADRINKALTTLRKDCTTEEYAVMALNAIAAGLVTTIPAISSDICESIQWIDKVADKIQFRGEA